MPIHPLLSGIAAMTIAIVTIGFGVLLVLAYNHGRRQ